MKNELASSCKLNIIVNRVNNSGNSSGEEETNREWVSAYTNHVKGATIGRNIFSRRYFYSSRVDSVAAAAGAVEETQGKGSRFISVFRRRNHLARLTDSTSTSSCFCLLDKSKLENMAAPSFRQEITCLGILGAITRKYIISL